MILVTLGTQDQKFYRLLDALENSKIKDKIIVQAGGSSDYQSKKMEIFRFIDYKDMEKYIDDADLIITHGGTGSIIMPLQFSIFTRKGGWVCKTMLKNLDFHGL